MTRGFYEIGSVASYQIDNRLNIMMLIEGDGLMGNFKIEDEIFLIQSDTRVSVNVGNVRFPKGVDGGLFVHGTLTDERAATIDLTGFTAIVAEDRIG